MSLDNDSRSDKRSPHGRRGLGVERRSFAITGIETRGDGGLPKLRGHAAVFSSLSQPIADWFGSFRERIAPGAFADSIAKDDIRALWNHDSGHVLGRTAAKTLDLSEDETGLFVDIKPPATTWARDLLVSIERGDVSQMSFGFRVPKNGDTWDIENGEDVRTLKKICLLEVSAVTFPAYTQTDIGARAIAGVEARDFYGALARVEAGAGSLHDVALLRRVRDALDGRSGLTSDEQHQLDRNSRRLRLAAAA